MAQLVRASAHRVEDSGSNPGPGENVSLKLLIHGVFSQSEENNCIHLIP